MFSSNLLSRCELDRETFDEMLGFLMDLSILRQTLLLFLETDLQVSRSTRMSHLAKRAMLELLSTDFER